VREIPIGIPLDPEEFRRRKAEAEQPSSREEEGDEEPTRTPRPPKSIKLRSYIALSGAFGRRRIRSRSPQVEARHHCKR
jgi:hypothetical protein